MKKEKNKQVVICDCCKCEVFSTDVNEDGVCSSCQEIIEVLGLHVK